MKYRVSGNERTTVSFQFVTVPRGGKLAAREYTETQLAVLRKAASAEPPLVYLFEEKVEEAKPAKKAEVAPVVEEPTPAPVEEAPVEPTEEKPAEGHGLGDLSLKELRELYRQTFGTDPGKKRTKSLIRELSGGGN